jgi:hypothetical protein
MHQLLLSSSSLFRFFGCEIAKKKSNEICAGHQPSIVVMFNKLYKLKNYVILAHVHKM